MNSTNICHVILVLKTGHVVTKEILLPNSMHDIGVLTENHDPKARTTSPPIIGALRTGCPPDLSEYHSNSKLVWHSDWDQLIQKMIDALPEIKNTDHLLAAMHLHNLKETNHIG